jgi:hypothetical protein
MYITPQKNDGYTRYSATARTFEYEPGGTAHSRPEAFIKGPKGIGEDEPRTLVNDSIARAVGFVFMSTSASQEVYDLCAVPVGVEGPVWHCHIMLHT